MAAAGREPPAPPAIPKGGARRSPGDRERGGGRPGSGCCHHRCRRARRNAPGARRGGWCPRSPLARARRSESRGGSLGGRRAACARAAAGRGLAAEAHASLAGTGISTQSRSPRPGLQSRSRRRPEPTTGAISLECASRRRGFHGAGEGGPATALSGSCALFAHGASNESSTTFSSCRSTG
jgi:hypothetical protein